MFQSTGSLTQRNWQRKRRGFTFIELILYLAIVSIVLGALVPFAFTVIGSGVKSSTQQEVFSSARFISERIKYEIRNATGINSVSATSLSLATATGSTNPTVIDLSGGNIRIKQGVSTAVNLNSANTTVPSLSFVNFTSGDNKTKHVQFTFTLNANFNSTVRQEYQETMTVEGSAEVRSN
jgi:prepilin-type N-terminal cleavage/methylation domain-containing protein